MKRKEVLRLKGVENATNMILICKRVKNKVISCFNLQRVDYEFISGFKVRISKE